MVVALVDADGPAQQHQEIAFPDLGGAEIVERRLAIADGDAPRGKGFGEEAQILERYVADGEAGARFGNHLLSISPASVIVVPAQAGTAREARYRDLA